MKTRVHCWLIAFLIGFSCAQSEAQPHHLTPTDVEIFLDGAMPLQIESSDIAGAVIVIVKDGQVFFSKGYGYADVPKKKPVSVEDTLFRPGSVSKLFTWTAIMQLVEQGKLNLDQDVNTYLDFKIPATFSTPITLRNIMTHSAGFEETIKDLFVVNAEDPKTLGKYLRTHIPRRIFPPGATPAYSNYSTALAGYIVERVSGEPFTKYIEEHIFKPLGMVHSTFAQPLPKNLQPLMSEGYRLGSDKAQDFEIVNAFPAGSLSASGGDMARFMISHLQQGKFEDRQILRPETAQLMHSRQLVLDEATNAMALGFYEESRNGLRIIGHGGDTIYFHSDLHLIHQHNLGFFISYNSAGRGESDVRGAVWKEFLDRYFPYTPPPGSKGLNHAKEVSGSYLISRRIEGSIFRLPYLLLQGSVSSPEDGVVEIDQFKGLNGKPIRWREIKPYIFRDDDGGQVVVFKRDPKTSAFRMIIPFPFFVYDSVTGLKNSQALLIVVGFIAGVLILKLLLWPVAAIIRRYYGAKLSADPKERSRLRWVRLICAMNVVILAAYAYFVVNGFESISILSSSNDTIIRIFQGIAVLSGIASLIVVYNSFRIWSSGEHGFWVKIQETAVALACLGFVWLLFFGRLVDFTLQY